MGFRGKEPEDGDGRKEGGVEEDEDEVEVCIHNVPQRKDELFVSSFMRSVPQNVLTLGLQG